jgi:hypothetical protein
MARLRPDGMVTMNAWQQQRVDELRQRIANQIERRRQQADLDQIKRLDAEIESLCRDLYDAERALRTTQ